MQEANITYLWRVEQFHELRKRVRTIPLDVLARILRFEDPTEVHRFLLSVPKKYFVIEWNILRFKRGWHPAVIALVAGGPVIVMVVFMIIFSMGGLF